MMVRRLTATVGLVLLICAAAAVAFAGGGAKAGDDTGARGFDTANLDRTCKPCDDFYQYVNGTWLKNNPIPAEYPMWGNGVIVSANNQKQLRGILEDAAANKSAAPGSNERKIGDFYASCMDTASIEAQGAKPLDAEFAQIARLGDKESISALIGHLHSEGVGSLFAFASTQDLMDSTKVTGEADQGGLGLPDRDYYTRTDDDSKKLRGQYVKHVTTMFTLLGDPPEKSAAEAKIVL